MSSNTIKYLAFNKLCLIIIILIKVVQGKQGLYQQLNIQKKPLTVGDYKLIAESDEYKTPNHFDYGDLERKYWKNIIYKSPMYGADVSGSITDKDVTVCVKFMHSFYLKCIFKLST